MRIWIEKCWPCKHFVTIRNHGSHASRTASYDPGRRPTAMAYEVTTSIEIAATPETVWAVLADLASYPRWHPAFLSVTGQLAVGSTLTIETTLPASGRKITGKVKVRTVEPGRELRWVSRMAGVTISD